MTTRDPGRQTLLIELCGLPGAGKTTVAGQLVRCLADQGLVARVADRDVSADVPRVLRSARKVIRLGRVVAADPRGEIAAARLLGSGQLSGRDTLALPAQWWVTKRALTRSRRLRGVAVVEEGLVQALWSAGLQSRHASVHDLTGLVEPIAAPDLVVHLDVPVSVALERLRTRPSRHSRVQRLEWSEQAKILHDGDVLLRDLLQHWDTKGLSQVLVVDGGDPDAGARLASVVIGLHDSRDLPPHPTSL